MYGAGGNHHSDPDEELARRLQYEEQQASATGVHARHPSSSTSGSMSTTRGYSTPQEVQDMELARQYAQMDLDHAAAVSPGSKSGGKSVNMRSQTMHTPYPVSPTRNRTHSREGRSSHIGGRTSQQRHRSSSPSGSGKMTDPFDYGSLSPRRYAQGRVCRDGIMEDDRNLVRHHRKTKTTSARLLIGGDSSLEFPPREDGGGGGGALRISPSHRPDQQQRLSRSQSPHSPTRLSMSLRDFDLPAREQVEGGTGAHTLHQRSIADHHYRVRSAGGYPQDSGARQRGMTVDSAGLQRQGFPRHHRVRSNPLESEDLELALQMQELEDRGMGRLNSDRELETELELDTSDDDGSRGGKSFATWFSKSETSVPGDDLKKMIAESGTNVNEISDEVLSELLGSSEAQSLKLAASSSSGLSAGLSVTSPQIQALRKNLGATNKISDKQEIVVNDATAGTTRTAMTLNLKGPPSKGPESAINAPPRGIPDAIPPSEAPPSASSRVSSPTKSANGSPSKHRRKRRGFLSFASRNNSRNDLTEGAKSPVPSALESGRKTPPPGSGGVPAAIPAAIPPPPGGSISAPVAVSTARGQSRSMSPNRDAARIPTSIRPRPQGMVHVRKSSFDASFRGTNICAACGLSHGTFLKAFDRKYHPECFRCTTCSGKIDPNDQFKYTTDDQGRKQPHHRECYMTFGVKCAICKKTIPATPDGRVPYFKHPFFDTEQMCLRHTEEHHRRCSGCQRFEPEGNRFIDLMDGDRCVCHACCQSVVVDNSDVMPLWKTVLAFFEKKLKLPVWGAMRDMPIIVVGSEALSEQMQEHGSIHASYTQPLASGLCLTEHSHHDSSGKQTTNVVGILCLTGLTKDLAAGVLAHEATHAWLKLHPKYERGHPIPPQVEEGLAQLIAMLLLSDGLEAASKESTEAGPSDEKRRQYYKFTIERDQHEIYGAGYRKAAKAYRDIGLEALLTHVIEYKDFPMT